MEDNICDTHVQSLVRVLSLRDPQIEAHTQRVTAMALALAQLWGLPKEQLIQMRRGALLHDIGKIGVPDAVLHKNGPLGARELQIMRMHPVYAYELLSQIPYLRSSIDIPYYHHERWDGAGYPRALKGRQIPFAARLFAVVDVWDALLSDRPYRPAWSRSKTAAYIRTQSGKHFDPEAVEAFARLIGGLDDLGEAEVLAPVISPVRFSASFVGG